MLLLRFSLVLLKFRFVVEARTHELLHPWLLLLLLF
jgi:hypothetical protein